MRIAIEPPCVPVDEDYDSRPESAYAFVKHLEEELAQKLVRWDALLSITALRISNVMTPDDYAGFETLLSGAKARRELGYEPKFGWRG